LSTVACCGESRVDLASASTGLGIRHNRNCPLPFRAFRSRPVAPRSFYTVSGCSWLTPFVVIPLIRKRAGALFVTCRQVRQTHMNSLGLRAVAPPRQEAEHPRGLSLTVRELAILPAARLCRELSLAHLSRQSCC